MMLNMPALSETKYMHIKAVCQSTSRSVTLTKVGILGVTNPVVGKNLMQTFVTITICATWYNS